MNRAALLLVSGLLCASPQPVALDALPRCVDREHWDLRIKALGVTGALATVDVEGTCGAGPVHVRADVKTTRMVSWVWRVHDSLDTLMDERGNTVSTSIIEDENSKPDARVDRYADGKVTTTWATPGQPRTREVEAPQGTLDAFSVLMKLRGAPLINGDIYRVPIFSKDAVYDGTVTVVGRATTELLDRDVRTIHLLATFLRDGKPSSVHADIFLTDDERRLPVRVEAGTRFGYLVSQLSAFKGPSAWQ